MRWYGPLQTPNLTALAIASACLLIVCLYAQLRRAYNRAHENRRRHSQENTIDDTSNDMPTASTAPLQAPSQKHKQKKWLYGYIIISVLLYLSGVVGIALTGSRGAALSLICGLIILWLWQCINWKECLFFIISLCIFSFSLSLGTRTIASIGDGSILARFTIWESCLALIYDYPFTGVGPQRVMIALNDWYLPSERYQRNYSPLNDTMMIACAWGLPGVWAFGTCISSTLLMLWNRKRAVLAGLSASLLIAHLCASSFQGHWCFGDWWWSLSPTLACILITATCFKKDASHFRWRSFSMISCTGGIVLATIVLCLLPFRRDIPYTTSVIQGHIAAHPINTMNPTSPPICLVHDSDADNDADKRWIHTALRFELLENGCSVMQCTLDNRPLNLPWMAVHDLAGRMLYRAAHSPALPQNLTLWPDFLCDPWTFAPDMNSKIHHANIRCRIISTRRQPFVSIRDCKNYADLLDTQLYIMDTVEMRQQFWATLPATLSPVLSTAK